MKAKLLLSLLLFLSAVGLQAQSPQAVNYQAIVRNPNLGVMPNTPVSFRFTILDSINPGTILYKETQALTTNSFGLVTAAIGRGTPVQGLFININWNVGSKYLDIEMDVNNTGTFLNMGTTQLISVPYAFHATNADTATYSKSNIGPPAITVDTVFSSLNNLSVTVIQTGTVLGTGTLNFTKQYPHSNVELLLASNIFGGNFNGGTSAIGFYLQIDGTSANYTTQYFIQQSGTQQFVTLDAIFAGLSAGPHVVTLSGFTYLGTSAGVGVDNGGYGGSIIVKETN
jgi:hypothetical protein